MTDNSLRTGLGLVRDAALEVARRPLHFAALVLGALITGVVSPLWGATLTWVGWLAARERMGADGAVALGEVLAPKRAREQYADGVWRVSGYFIK